jgi:GMP synthase-like glutamine amidotransferase
MRILSLEHGPNVGAEFYRDVALEDGHELEEWSVVDEAVPPRPVEDYDAVLVFGGQMNVDQEDAHPWLRGEDGFVRSLLEREVPVLGVCLGGQLLAKAAGAHVGPSPEPERGFVRAVLTEDAADDSLFGSLPQEFDVFVMHGYAFRVPEGGVELARSRVCSQAFRLGERAWGIQFHPEIRVDQIAGWLAASPSVANGDQILAELRSRIEEWQAFGARLLRSFLAVAGRRHTSVTVPGTAPTL